jgi:citrate lyase beta subunit
LSGALAGVRSLLFAPACEEDAVSGALRSTADAAVIDLEDLTPAGRKDEARRLLPRLVGAARAEGAIAVRINADAGERAADLDLVARLPVDFLLVPKATPELLAELGPLGLPVVAIVETARGLHDAYEIALAPRVEALALGANDLGADLGLAGPLDGDILGYARARLIFESAAAGLRAPFDRVSPYGTDAAALRADATVARDLGFGGKSTTRPEHAALIDAVFAVGSAHRAIEGGGSSG